jgi:hypothetical protein
MQGLFYFFSNASIHSGHLIKTGFAVTAGFNLNIVRTARSGGLAFAPSKRTSGVGKSLHSLKEAGSTPGKQRFFRQ